MRTIAFHLPQFHPTPENSQWWGDGFTEWRNVASATALYQGHHQPQLPSDLGFYDLRLPEIRHKQAALARAAGIDAFCYYHYWFNGRRLLERPFSEVLWSGSPDFPFCLCWANESWTGVWHGAPERVLMQQAYGGQAEFACHFNNVLPAFLDKRYVRIDDKPVVVVWRPFEIPEGLLFLETWRTLARENGLAGIHFVGFRHQSIPFVPLEQGYDGEIHFFMPPRRDHGAAPPGARLPAVYDMKALINAEFFSPKQPSNGMIYPCSIPNWDNTPRTGVNGIVFENATPELFGDQLSLIKRWSATGAKPPQLHFIKSWNEWAEGNFLEPDRRYGHGFLDAFRTFKRSE